MSTESLKENSSKSINIVNDKQDKTLTPGRVNIDVLKKKIYEKERKEKKSYIVRLFILGFCIFICAIGFIKCLLKLILPFSIFHKPLLLNEK